MCNESSNKSAYARPIISKKNEYYISKHRYYELVHFCLQYKEWTDETNKNLIKTALLVVPEWMRVAMLKAVTEDLSFTYVNLVLGVPCCKDVYYRERRKFFYELSLIKK